MSKRRQISKAESDSEISSSESEVEYEPIVVADADGNEYIVPAETNPLAPIPTVINRKTGQTETLQISPTVRLSKIKAKKGKVFVDKNRMLSLIESVNTTQDAKIKEKLDRDVSFVKRSSEIEESIKARRGKKNERLEKIKDHLRKGGVRLKGENKRKVRDIKGKQEEEKKIKQKAEKFAARNQKSKRKVRFTE
jgi:hypothetical protein